MSPLLTNLKRFCPNIYKYLQNQYQSEAKATYTLFLMLSYSEGWLSTFNKCLYLLGERQDTAYFERLLLATLPENTCYIARTNSSLDFRDFYMPTDRVLLRGIHINIERQFISDNTQATVRRLVTETPFIFGQRTTKFSQVSVCLSGGDTIPPNDFESNIISVPIKATNIDFESILPEIPDLLKLLSDLSFISCEDVIAIKSNLLTK